MGVCRSGSARYQHLWCACVRKRSQAKPTERAAIACRPMGSWVSQILFEQFNDSIDKHDVCLCITLLQGITARDFEFIQCGFDVENVIVILGMAIHCRMELGID